MCDLDVFNKSVRGYLHKIKGIGMEDASEVYADKTGRFYIAVVADGHGDKACMRSAKGSQMAAETAVECLQELAEDILKVLHEEESEKETVRDDTFGNGFHGIKEQLEDRILRQYAINIVTKWQKKVEDDLKEHGLTEEELQQAGSYEASYRKGKSLPHVYGTTLLAALWIDDYLILLQQGDGRCVVFYEDGTVQASDELGMLDERCHENVTTSLCDTDAAQALWKHSVVVPLKQKKVMACFLGCDGVEDSYVDMEGLYMFYRNLMCEINDKETRDFEEWMEKKYLPEFSQNGSGDDISVAGIVDRNRIGSFIEQFQKQVEKYNLSEELRQLEEKKASMSRKHGILQERAAEQEKLCKEKEIECKRAHISQEEYQSVNKEYSEAAKEFKSYDEKYQGIQDEIDNVRRQINALDSAAKEPPEKPDKSQKSDPPDEMELSGVDGELWNKYRELEEKNQKLEAKIQELEAQKQEPKADIQKLEEEIRELKRQQEESKEQIRELVQGGTKFLKKNKPLAYGAGVLLLVLVLLALGVLLEYRSVKREYQAVKQELEAYDKEYQEVQAGIEEVNLKIEALNSAAKNLSENPDKSEAKIQELEVKIQELETQIQELEAQKPESEEEIQESETEKEESEEEKQEPEEEKQEPETEIQESEEEIQELKQGGTKYLKEQAVRNPYA